MLNTVVYKVVFVSVCPAYRIIWMVYSIFANGLCFQYPSICAVFSFLGMIFSFSLLLRSQIIFLEWVEPPTPTSIWGWVKMIRSPKGLMASVSAPLSPRMWLITLVSKSSKWFIPSINGLSYIILHFFTYRIIIIIIIIIIMIMIIIPHLPGEGC